VNKKELKVLAENENGKSYEDGLQCPNCKYSILGFSNLIDFIDEELIFDDYQYDAYTCPNCLCLFSFNTQNMELGKESEEYDGKEILGLNIWVWNGYEEVNE